MGESARGPVTIKVRAPDRPLKMFGVSFSATEALKAQVETRLLRTDASGTATVRSATTLGASISYSASQPGAYHVELRIRPGHLATALGSSSALASKQYLWLISNPIYVTK
jgi:hypothetical protein